MPQIANWFFHRKVQSREHLLILCSGQSSHPCNQPPMLPGMASFSLFATSETGSWVSESVSLSFLYVQGRKHVSFPLEICSARTSLLMVLLNL